MTTTSRALQEEALGTLSAEEEALRQKMLERGELKPAPKKK